MKYKLISLNIIQIGKEQIVFPINTVIDKIETLNEVICFNTTPFETDLDWNNIETHQIWKERCVANPSQLFCYDFSGKLKWQLPDNTIVGFGQVFPNLKKGKDFITPRHYSRYIKKYKDKELLEVYSGDFRFVIDANTGEIYDKIENH